MKTTYLSVLVAAAILGAPQETLGAFKLTTLFSFSETNGIFPYGRMNQARDGNFYGTTFLWGQGYYGTVFKLSPSGRLSTVVAFDGTNGYEPWAGLVQAADGTLYGTTQAGGPQMAGSIFAISAYKRFQNICFLDETNGFYPHGFMPNGLIIATDGNLYGTTISGGDFDSGTVLKLTTNGEPTTLFSFTRTNGWQPRSDLVQGSDGDLYGTTTYGGERWERGDGNGTVFRIKTDGSLVWLNSFSKTNGLWPIGQLIECGGAFYGTTASGGTYDTIDEGSGTIFKVTPEGTLSVVYSFSPVDDWRANAEGAAPTTGLVRGADGLLYGTTSWGGTNGAGTIFRISTNGVFEVVYQFGTVKTKYNTPFDGGQGPKTLVLANDGSFYGTTYHGGANNNVGNGGYGTVFHLSKVRPTLSISRPSRVIYGNPNVQLIGSAKGLGGVSNVLVRANGSSWISAATGNDWKKWRVGAVLTPGQNTLEAYAVDCSGDVSRTNKVQLYFIAPIQW